MKTINLPKILLIIYFIVLAISIFGALIEPVSLFGIYYFGLIISPVSIVVLIVWKLFNRNRKNNYFIITFVVNLTLFILSAYSALHLFDNFMSLS